MTDSLQKMGDKRPGKQASPQRALKPLLGAAYVFTGYPKLPPRQLGRAMYHVR